MTSLSLGGDAVAETGLRGLSTWLTLEYLNIQNDIGDVASRDWAEIARLPCLSSIGIAAKYLPGLLSAPHLPTLETVHVTNIREDTDLTPLYGNCPQVRTLRLYSEEHSTDLVAAPYQALFPEAEVTVHPTRPLLFRGRPAQRRAQRAAADSTTSSVRRNRSTGSPRWGRSIGAS
ncbi:hypothetical protein [Streptomyces sp. NPDC002516]